MGAEGALNAGANAALDSLDDVLDVFAKYIAPLVGLFVGWLMGGIFGGPALVGQMVYNGVEKIDGISAANATKIADLIGGLTFAGIWAALGGLLWKSSSKPIGKDKMAGSVIGAVVRFFSGLFFGLAINSAYQGLTGNVTSGALDSWAETLASG